MSFTLSLIRAAKLIISLTFRWHIFGHRLETCAWPVHAHYVFA
jgi:hypothetical protein